MDPDAWLVIADLLLALCAIYVLTEVNKRDTRGDE